VGRNGEEREKHSLLPLQKMGIKTPVVLSDCEFS
jgi:hypothetical protein